MFDPPPFDVRIDLCATYAHGPMRACMLRLTTISIDDDGGSPAAWVASVIVLIVSPFPDAPRSYGLMLTF